VTGTLWPLAAALVLFVGGHFVLSSHALRPRLIGGLGDRGFPAFYSVVAALGLAWTIWAYIKSPYVELWVAPTAVKHLTLSVMIVVSMMVIASFSPQNPAIAGKPAPDLARGPVGIFHLTRHPFNWGMALWALTHLAANGDAASLMLFGALAFLALAGSAHIDSRKRRQFGAAWETYARQTSHIPFVAALQGRTRIVWREIGWRPVILGAVLYLVLLILHEPVIGIAPMSLVSGVFG
jgi:uncharacterized membrane protein